ncbi:sensor histidine kinase [Niabella aquatica]
MKAREIYNKIEFWIVTTVAASLLLSLLIMSKNPDAHGSYRFDEYHIKYDFWKHLFLPSLAQIIIYYSGYVLISRFVEEKKDNWAKAGSVFGLYLIIATLISVTYTYTDAWMFGKYDFDTRYIYLFTDGFTTVAIIFLIYSAYYIVRALILKSAETIRAKQSNKKLNEKTRSWLLFGFLAFACWIAIIIILGANSAREVMAFWAVGVPYALLIVWIHIKYLIPLAGKERFKSAAYLLRVTPIIFLLSLLCSALCAGISGTGNIGAFFLILIIFAICIIVPVSWYISKNRVDKEVLQTALGSSQANLNFLRSQINPHFLFNALNTLYGTALQENAERTGEGIQKLGDMMRFMLHENMQEKISLAREVDYLNNYISLQKLRTASSPEIIIQTNIEEQLNRLDVSPMLLIPFVENAFKHGISLQQPSFINISLHTKENILFFDVHNSVHPKNDYDPEKMKSGIGLQNVKQRLALLYPKKHELIIRESAKEFFVHLTINL